MKRVMTAIAMSVLVCVSPACEESTAPEQGDGPWTTYTTSDGLPYDAVGAIAFGPDGESWCVPLIPETGGGVAHFDGTTWKHYTEEDGLGSDFVLWMENTLAVSSDGVLWVGTFGGGVSRFDGETWTTYTTRDGLLADKVSAVAIAPNGNLWCTHPAPDCGISRFDGKNWTTYTTSDMGVTPCNLLNITFDPDGTLWASRSNVVVHHSGQTWTSFSSEMGLRTPVAIYMDIGPDGRIWVSGGGVSCYDGGAWSHHSLEEIGASGSGEGLIPLAVDSENVLWVGVYGEGVFRYDGNSWNKLTSRNGPALNNVFSITLGPDDSLWFGTESGISRYRPTDAN